MHFVDYSDTDDEESHPIAKGDIMGYSNEDNGDDNDGDDGAREQDKGTEEKLVVPDIDGRETVRAWARAHSTFR